MWIETPVEYIIYGNEEKLFNGQREHLSFQMVNIKSFWKKSYF